MPRRTDLRDLALRVPGVTIDGAPRSGGTRGASRSDLRSGTVGGLRAGDRIDGARVKSSKSVPYPFARTWDIAVTGPTGFYISDGVVLASTLRAPRCPSGSYKMPPTQKPSGRR